MFKKTALFLGMVLLCFPLSSKAMIEEDLEKIDKALFLLRGPCQHAAVLRYAMRTGIEIPFLENLKKLSQDYLKGVGFDTETSERRARTAEDGLSRDFQMDALFLENLQGMLLSFKKILNSQNDTKISSCLSDVYGEILGELEVYLSSTQSSFLLGFTKMFGKSDAFGKSYYGGSLCMVEDEDHQQIYAFVGGPEEREEFQKTQLFKCLKGGVKTLKRYSKENIDDFKMFMEQFSSFPFNINATLMEYHLSLFSEMVEVYDILEKLNLVKRKEVPLKRDSLYQQLINLSQRAQSGYLRGKTKLYNVKTLKDVQKHEYEEQKVFLDPQISKIFDGLRDEFSQNISEASFKYMNSFQKLLDAAQRQIRELEKGPGKKKKGKGFQKRRTVEEAAEEDSSISEPESSAFSSEIKIETLQEGVLEGEREGIQEASQSLSSEGEGEAGEAIGGIEEELEDDLTEWWKAYQTSKKPKSTEKKPRKEEDRRVEKEMKFRLSAEAFSFFSVMGDYKSWDPNLKMFHLNAFQSEIFSQYEAWLGKDASPSSVLLKARYFARPPLILPNLNPNSGSSDPYLLFRMPHPPHGRSENNFYPALKYFYSLYFTISGLSLGNVSSK